MRPSFGGFMPFARLWLAIQICLLTTVGLSGDALDNWHWRQPVPQGNNLSSIAFGNGLYVAVGDDATILTSTNATAWQTHNLEIPRRLSAIAFGNNRFVAIGNDFILVSTNGVDWTDASTGTPRVLITLAFGAGQFIAFGYDPSSGAQPQLLVSTNGLEWISHDLDPSVWLDSITWGQGTFVGVGGDDTCTSTDGLSWQCTPAPVQGLEKVRFLNGRFVAIGYDDDFGFAGDEVPTFAYSTTGLDWIGGFLDAYSNYNFYQSVRVNGVGFVDGHYIAVGSYASGVTTVWWSEDARIWSLHPEHEREFSALPNDILTESQNLILVGDSGLIATSSNGTTWTEIVSPGERKCSAIAYGNGIFVAVGAAGAIQTSRDGVTWTSSHVNPPWIDWTDIAYGNERFVAVSGSPGIMTSTDGTNWIVQTTNPPLQRITYANGAFAALGGDRSGNFHILLSPDGLNWKSGLSGYGFTLWDITHGNGTFLAAGFGTVLTSQDGILWTTNSGPSAYRVAFGNLTFVAANGQQIQYSTNGLSWNLCTTPPLGPYDMVQDVAYAHGVFVAVYGHTQLNGGGVILTSVDGIHWRQRHSPARQDLTGIAANESSFVLLGPSGAILQSDDIRPRLQIALCCVAPTHQLTLTGISNCFYRTEVSTNLMDWTPSWTNRAVGDEVLVFRSGALLPARFYRAQLIENGTSN